MGSRGGGRGRGRFGGGGFRYAKQESFVLFPDIQLTAIDHDKINKGRELVMLRNKLLKDLHDLPYFLEETFTTEEETADIERYSKNVSGTKRVSLENSGYMMLQPGYFPLELVRGTKRRLRKVDWNPQRDQERLDYLEGRESKYKDDEFKDKKEGEEEEENEEDIDDEIEDSIDSRDDYNRGLEFDDDSDGGYNPKEDDDDEGTLD